jgi:predicted Zn-dependent protease
MSSLFYILGRKVGPTVRKAQWIWQSLAGSDADAIKLENQVGHDLVREIWKKLEPYQEEKTKHIHDQIGPRLARCVANRFRTFHFETVKGAEPNAFALPGGFIFVTGSLVELCNRDEDELAFILGHEMAHVIRGHAMKRIISNSAINIASRSVLTRGRLAGWIQKTGIQFLESAYSQDLESEADKLGILLSDAAGFNPEGSIRLLRRLAELNHSNSRTGLGNYFSSHPAFEERICNIRRLIDKRQ